MRIALSREIDLLELHLSFLATVGSTSPYVGLFGTVWGIMNSFRALGNVSQATLALVAPGIAEALIATAMGLFAATRSEKAVAGDEAPGAQLRAGLTQSASGHVHTRPTRRPTVHNFRNSEYGEAHEA